MLIFGRVFVFLQDNFFNQSIHKLKTKYNETLFNFPNRNNAVFTARECATGKLVAGF